MTTTQPATRALADRARELTRATYGECIRDGDERYCDGGHDQGYWAHGDDACDQFETWVAGAMVALEHADEVVSPNDIRDRARELVLAEYGGCVRDGGMNTCSVEHNEGWWDEEDETCEQFESWVDGTTTTLEALADPATRL